jgi:hypothetical protein
MGMRLRAANTGITPERTLQGLKNSAPSRLYQRQSATIERVIDDG